MHCGTLYYSIQSKFLSTDKIFLMILSLLTTKTKTIEARQLYLLLYSQYSVYYISRPISWYFLCFFQLLSSLSFVKHKDHTLFYCWGVLSAGAANCSICLRARVHFNTETQWTQRIRLTNNQLTDNQFCPFLISTTKRSHICQIKRKNLPMPGWFCPFLISKESQ